MASAQWSGHSSGSPGVFHVRCCSGEDLSPQGGDVRRALTADCEMAQATGVERRLGWYAAGQHIALDVARGLHFLHKSGVGFPVVFCVETPPFKSRIARAAQTARCQSPPSYVASLPSALASTLGLAASGCRSRTAI